MSMIDKSVVELYSSCGILLNEKKVSFQEFYDLVVGNYVYAIKSINKEETLNIFRILRLRFENPVGLEAPIYDILGVLLDNLEFNGEDCPPIVKVGHDWYSLADVKYVGNLLGLQ